ncbi:hypothetical protein SAMN05421636_106104 [Pricia antarctica]|uniref:DUF4179 domain-containing protein n=1 Tax=Pricia antarctica TaxID=641691 RepID=A0A1G7EA58_9FLAO|nr:hypothetical protein [Pricia antarctica]SDE60604.1 hypothetical protein SAMN05421636_106104 [Pricia antarctica]
MEKENIEKLFDSLRGSFDTRAPKAGHELRFLEKLNASKGIAPVKKRKKLGWKPFAIAASIALLCTLAFGLYQSEPTLEEQVAHISPEVSRTSFYFSGLIEEQVKALENEGTPQTRQIIDDTLLQLGKLESDYAQLEQDLVNGGNSKLLLSAMITNFRTRIDFLQEVLDTIESIKNLKPYDDTETTI